MNIDSNLLLQIGGWFIGFWIFISKQDKKIDLLSYKIDELKKTQEKCNNLQERMAGVEASSRSAHHRLDLAGIGSAYDKRRGTK